ncbi:MAG: helix-turn-helix transcriptional regulator [Syntrophomonas sp.]
MLQKHITMTDIAAELGISVTYVSEIFKGTRKGEKYRKKITQLLGLEEEASLCQNN